MLFTRTPNPLPFLGVNQTTVLPSFASASHFARSGPPQRCFSRIRGVFDEGTWSKMRHCPFVLLTGYTVWCSSGMTQRSEFRYRHAVACFRAAQSADIVGSEWITWAKISKAQCKQQTSELPNNCKIQSQAYAGYSLWCIWNAFPKVVRLGYVKTDICDQRTSSCMDDKQADNLCFTPGRVGRVRVLLPSGHVHATK